VGHSAGCAVIHATGPAPGAGSAFRGGTSYFYALAGEAVSNLLAQCDTTTTPPGTGVKLLHLGVGHVTM
jgi:hypothetical protein